MVAFVRRRIGGIALHALLVCGGLLMLFPFLWMVSTAFKGESQMIHDPLGWLPDPWTPSNFPDALDAMPFGRAYWNSFYIATITVVATLLTASMAAYAFTRIEFPLSRTLFVLFLVTQMVPSQVTMVPLYIMLSHFGWIDTHLALIVPAIANPFAVFMMRQFIRSVPVELEEAARLDGANRWTVFTRIVLPNVKPGMAALGIIVFLASWNSFLIPLVFLNSEENFTVPMLLASFKGQHGGLNFGLVLAASTISVVPMLIVFLIGQRKIINSMAASGLGGR
ncbi:carbohydrate ABC transporter permease [Streptomyces sp. SID3343]|uniref:carbohydrate ABC transporter permease n=1 Tax=Streptomyces sp. SID3343 TaxID=2690260 RepID=UPI00136C56B1|nr:carbohydrate ABC transporter permease [Streptomyces sp. SID3343]MYW04237.1 ABC transporter permease subunit [Streptomyces sp. SID3343]